MLERIKELERLSLPLEPNALERRFLREKVIDYTESFLEELPEHLAFQATQDQGIGILDSPISEEPISIDKALALLGKNVDFPGVTIGSPGHMAFIPVGGVYTASLGDLLSSISNKYSGLFFAAPGAVRIENMLLSWMAEFLGYPQSALGNLTSGGSPANLVGVITAREAHDLHARDYPRSVVYITEQTHHSVEKALHIAGLKDCIRRLIPLDERYHMRSEALAETVALDKARGHNPWLVVASAGTTDTGAVDPLPALADIAASHGLWLHVDGAYGASFALCEPGKKRLAGIERSDSLVIDPHKGMFMPLGTGAVLVREGSKLLQAFSADAHYMQDGDALASPESHSPADLSPELSRPFRGLRLWLALKLAGVAPFRAALEEKLLLASYFYQRIQQIDGFQVGPPPDLSVVTFRYLPKRGDANQFNQELIHALQQDGRVFMSSTMIDGQFTLRMVALAFRTHLDTIELALDILEEKALQLEGG